MLRRIFHVLISIPVAIVLIALMVANRAPVPLSVDIFNPGNPALTFTAPFFVWLAGAALVGVLAGGIATWLADGKLRRDRRTFRKEAQQLRYEVEETKRKAGTDNSTAQSLLLQRPS